MVSVTSTFTYLAGSRLSREWKMVRMSLLRAQREICGDAYEFAAPHEPRWSVNVLLGINGGAGQATWVATSIVKHE